MKVKVVLNPFLRPERSYSDFGHLKKCNSSTGIPNFSKTSIQWVCFPKKNRINTSFLSPISCFHHFFSQMAFLALFFFPNPLIFKFAHFLFNLHKQIGSFESFLNRCIPQKPTKISQAPPGKNVPSKSLPGP